MAVDEGAVLDQLGNRKALNTVLLASALATGCIPLTLDTLNRAGQLKPGELVCLSGFGAGLVVGTMLLRW